MSQENVEIVRRSQEAWNANDLDAFVSISPPNAEWVIAEENPNARTLRGRDEIISYLRDWADTMPGLHYEVAERIAAGDAVVSIGTVAGRVGDGPEIRVTLAFVSYFEGGMPVRTEEYLDPGKALEAVGLSEQDAHADS
jgi:ketosteroid isomerase-like protein